MIPSPEKRFPLWFYYAILFLGVVCIGWSAIFVKLADVPGITSAFYRMFFGFLGVIPIWFLRSRSISNLSPVKIAILSGVIFALDIAVWNVSIMLSKASISTLLANLAPVWVGIGSILFFRSSPGRIFWLGTTVSLVGVTLIIGFNIFELSILDPGHMLAIIASIFYATYLLVMRKGRMGMDTVSFTAISMLSSTIILFIIVRVAGVPLLGFSANSWGALVGLGLIAQLGGWLAINYALGYIASTTASVVLLSQTVVTTLLAYLFLSEKLLGIEILGSVFVLMCIFLVTRNNSTKPTQEG